MSMSEDFGILASSIGIPSCFFLYGGTDPKTWDQMEGEGRLGSIPGNHSGGFKLDVKRTLRTGVDGYMGAALTFLLTEQNSGMIKGKI
jgi:metal-dependent amidase/aminoacylase/carboxypeptidase family protein